MDHTSATGLWQQLESGSWRVVDQLDRDHRRYLLAEENVRAAWEAHALTPRERQVVECASRGLSNKVIAYDLGVSSSTVSTHLSHAAAKLGLSSRATVIQMFVALAAKARPEVAVTYVGSAGNRLAVISLPMRPNLPTTLSPVEREVVALAAAGESNAAIATTRGVSARTVENQLAAAMKKLGVSSRASLTAFVMSCNLNE